MKKRYIILSDQAYPVYSLEETKLEDGIELDDAFIKEYDHIEKQYCRMQERLEKILKEGRLMWRK